MPSTVAEPGQTLTWAERDVLQLSAYGHKRRAIADLRGVSPHTVDQHMADARVKLCARTKTQAVAIAWRYGMIV